MIRKRFYSRPGKTILQRFAEKCAFDPYTGCVMWVGAQTAGKGHSQPYGRFRGADRSVLAHRWAAEHIHGFDIDGLQVDHCCPAGPSTLCVQHLQPETPAVNRALQHSRPGRHFQALETRRYWVHVQVGIEPDPEIIKRIISDVPFFDPPAWLLPFLKKEIPDVCPF